ncbi:Aste57867_20728 [Aphanomyces stellatus]|uniref:Aste57867_20728 protein n=1 Tax=Aphanomyces stellatus TaxID=120398 RepID=A0A485LFM3_9STRA|nr:hypothetical protein As57867_020660 [Aphanomyces stellatus]VFT97408.1 Aste57867_20728 [Aphanomyces stellatus]
MQVRFILTFAAIASAAESASHWAEYLALPNITSITTSYLNLPDHPRTLDVRYNGAQKTMKSFALPPDGLSLVGAILPEGLETFALEGIQLKSIPNEFKWPSTLKTLGLSSNHLSAFPKRLPRSIENLYLTDNQISKLPQTIDLPRLVNLHVGDNKLTTLPDGFSLPRTLEFLFLSNNQITCLPANSSWISQVRMGLYLDSNQIQDLPTDSIFPELTTVANNRITTLANLALPHSFDIGNNPLETVYRVTMSSKDSYWLTSASTLTTFVLEESVFQQVTKELVSAYYTLAWKSDNDSIAAVCELEQGTVRTLKGDNPSTSKINVCVVSPY